MGKVSMWGGLGWSGGLGWWLVNFLQTARLSLAIHSGISIWEGFGQGSWLAGLVVKPPQLLKTLNQSFAL